MSTIKSARADFVNVAPKGIAITMTFDEGQQVFFLHDQRTIETFDNDAQGSLTAALATLSMTQGTPFVPNIYNVETLKASDDDAEGAAYVAEYKRVLAEQVAIAEWSAAA